MAELQHPMQPPPELFAEWLAEALRSFPVGPSGEVAAYVARRAYAAGADAQLEACVEWVQGYAECGDSLRAAMRPKPPSLKERAMPLLETYGTAGVRLDAGQCELIRRALEALPDDH